MPPVRKRSSIGQQKSEDPKKARVEVASVANAAGTGASTTGLRTESGKKRQAPAAAADPAFGDEHTSLRESRTVQISDDFRRLELVLNALRVGGKVPVWDVVREGVEKSSVRAFTAEDLSVLLRVWPQALTCNWRFVSADPSKPKETQLCIAADLSQPTGEFRGGTQTQNRMKYFDALLGQKALDSKEEFQPDISIFPLKPNFGSSSSSSSGSNSSSKTKSPRKKASSLSLFSATELQEIQERNRQGAATTDRAAVTASMPAGGIDALRQMAIEREKESKQRQVLIEAERAKTSLIRKVKALPALCDTLRSLAVAKRSKASATFITTDLIRDLIPSLRVDERELRSRLAVVATELPEFLSVIAPNNRLPFETLRINLLADYAEVRRKCLAVIQRECSS